MGITTNNNNGYNVCNLFNDFEAFQCTTPTFSKCNMDLFSNPPQHTPQAFQEFPPFSNVPMHWVSLDDPSLSLQQTGPSYDKFSIPNTTSIKTIPPSSYIVQNEDATAEENSQPTRTTDQPTKCGKNLHAKTNTGAPLQVHIKPARKTSKYYVSYFPDKLYCAPYKYDVRLRFGSNTENALYLHLLDQGLEQNLTFKLLDGETHKPLKLNAKGEQALLVEKAKKQDEEEEEEEQEVQVDDAERREVVYRLCFTVCSFHNFRRPFVIQCLESQTGLVLFESNPFHIYARKTNKDKNADTWVGEQSEPSEPIKTLFTTDMLVPATTPEDDDTQLKTLKRKREEDDAPTHKRQKVADESPHQSEEQEDLNVLLM